MILILALAAWFALGISGFRYWWTKDFGNLEGAILGLQCFVCLLGPLSWVIGYFIHAPGIRENRRQAALIERND